MKKLFYLIVALMLVPALVACGATAAGQPSEQPSEPPVEVTQSPAVVTDEPVVVNTPTPDTGIVALDAILDEINNDAQPGSARVATPVRAPYATLLVTEVKKKLSRRLKRGDILAVRGKTFRIEVIRPDGIGGLVCKLKRQEAAGDAQ